MAQLEQEERDNPDLELEALHKEYDELEEKIKRHNLLYCNNYTHPERRARLEELLAEEKVLFKRIMMHIYHPEPPLSPSMEETGLFDDENIFPVDPQVT